MIVDAAGDIFGTTEKGGDPAKVYLGTVFEIPAGNSSLTVLAYLSGPDGSYPQANLVQNANGDLFGTSPDFEGDVFEVAKGAHVFAQRLDRG